MSSGVRLVQRGEEGLVAEALVDQVEGGRHGELVELLQAEVGVCRHFVQARLQQRSRVVDVLQRGVHAGGHEGYMH